MRNSAAFLCCVLVVAACTPDEQETGSITPDQVRDARTQLPPALVALLDSGNATFRARDFNRALLHYRAVIARDDEAAAAWFGICIASLALGDTVEAKAALRRAQELAPGATLLR